MDSVKIIFIIGYFIFIKWYTYIINLKFSLLKLKPKPKIYVHMSMKSNVQSPTIKNSFHVIELVMVVFQILLQDWYFLDWRYSFKSFMFSGVVLPYFQFIKVPSLSSSQTDSFWKFSKPMVSKFCLGYC